MKTKKLSIILFFVLSLALVVAGLQVDQPEIAHAAPGACVAGPHSGTIDSDEQWCLAHSPHYVNGTVTVIPGVTLTIEPGVTIKFAMGESLKVNGNLTANGTSALPITLTSQAAVPQPGDWGAIDVNIGSITRLSYCDIGYGGGGSGNDIFYTSASDVQIRHCRIHHSEGRGIWNNAPNISPIYEDVELDHNGSWPVQQTYISMTPTYIDLNLHDNYVDALQIDSSNLASNVTLDGSPAALNGAPIYYAGGSIDPGYTLTVTPGTTIKMGGAASLNVNGGLIAKGTSALPIKFTSQQAAPQAGDWGTINANSGSTLRLAYCDVGYGGNTGDHALYIATSTTEIHQCLIHDSVTHGIWLTNNKNLTLQNVVFLRIKWAAMYITGGSSITGLHLTLAVNGTGVYVANNATLTLKNTILAQNAYGLNIISGGSANLAQTLWDSNTTPVSGTVTETGHIDGLAAFAADGYHLTSASVALGRGADVGVTDDIDGQARPMPGGTAPDLGADESNLLPASSHIYLPVVWSK